MYKINDCMLGPDATMADAERAAEWLNAHGFDCEPTGDAGLINGYGDSVPEAPTEALWEQMLAEVFG